MDTHQLNQQHSKNNASSSRDTPRTRSRTNSLPPASRNQTTVENLTRGLPASGANPRKNSRSTPGARQDTVPEPPGTVDNNNQPRHRMSHEELDRIQQVCAVETQPIREDILRVQDKFNDLEAGYPADDNANSEAINNIRREQQQFQQQQKLQMDNLLEALGPLAQLKGVIDDVVTLRHDTNQLMESQSLKATPHDVHRGGKDTQPSRDTPQKNTLVLPSTVNLEDETTNVKYKPFTAVRNGGVPLPSTAKANHRENSQPIHQISSDDESDYYGDRHRYELESSDEDEMSKIPFYSRDKGPRYPGLTAIRPADPDFDRLLNYRYYRLIRREQRRDANTMLEASKRLKALTLALGDCKFNGQDPVQVLGFLTRLTEEADLNGMSESQIYAILPRFLSGSAEIQFRASRSNSHMGGVKCWAEAVQYLLSTYATPSAIRQAVQQLLDTKQRANEDEADYSARLSAAIHRCGNAYDESRKMTFFINGLNPEIQPIVARHRERTPRRELRYEHLVQFARDEGQSSRARSGVHRQPTSRTQLPGPRKSEKHSVHFLDSRDIMGQDIQSQQLLYTDTNEFGYPNSMHDSIATNDLPSTEATTIQDYPGSEHVMFTRNVKPSRLHHSDGRTNFSRPGWQTKQRVVCYQCYALDSHIAPDCDIQLAQLPLIISNYEKLPADGRDRVPRTAYNLAKQFTLPPKSTRVPLQPDTTGPASKN